MKRGPGKPRLAPEGVTRLELRIDARRREIAKLAGDGNESKGVRVALDFWEDHRPAASLQSKP